MDPRDFDLASKSNSSFTGLLWASVGMFCGCYVAGLVPLSLSLSENRIKTMSVFGSGLLVGTALSVIIPEGLHMVMEHDSCSSSTNYNHHHNAHPHEQRDLVHSQASPDNSLLPKTQGDPFLIPNDLIPDDISSFNSKPGDRDSLNSRKQGPIPKVVLDKVAGALHNGEDLEHSPHKREEMEVMEGTGPYSHQSLQRQLHEGESGEEGIANVIGLSLITGFVFMLIIDHFAAGSHSHSHSPHSQYTHPSDAENAHKNELGSNNRSRTKLTTTLGLLIHAAADGIAMAAVTTTQKSDLQFLVFIAIMLHKFPASFGLVSFLLNEKVDKQRVRKHLMAFSLAAPVGAFATYILMVLPGMAGASDGLFANFSGKALLFSAGTFLYVATIHILPNIQLSSSGGHFSTWHVIVLVGGAFCPALLNVFHHH